MIFITFWHSITIYNFMTNHHRIIVTLKWLSSLKYIKKQFISSHKTDIHSFQVLGAVFHAGNDYFCLRTVKGMDCLMVNNVWPIWLCSMTKWLNLWIRESNFLKFSKGFQALSLKIFLCTRRNITGQVGGLAGWIAGVCPGIILFNIFLSQTGGDNRMKVRHVFRWH